jgi:hypothetical protein
MPRFMMFMFPGETDESKWDPSVEDVKDMMAYNEELTKAGVLLALDGLHPTSRGARVRFSGGTGTITDGPFTEAKELIGGYWLIQAKDKAEAVEWASRVPGAEGDVVEVREVFEMEDFSKDVQAVAQLSEQPPEQTSAA